jgi:hypothetical protein
VVAVVEAVIVNLVTLVILVIYYVAPFQLIHHIVYRFMLAPVVVQDHRAVAHQGVAVAPTVLVTTEAVEVMPVRYPGLAPGAVAEPQLLYEQTDLIL